MKLENMKLGVKIGLGFAFLVGIMALLGVFSVLRMNDVKSEARQLEEAYIPEVDVSGNVERNALLAMYEIRGYGLTGEAKYLDAGKDRIQRVKAHLEEASRLAGDHSSLEALRESIQSAFARVEDYELLVNNTEAQGKAMEEDRRQLDESAVRYMRNGSELMEEQLAWLKSEAGDALVTGTSSALREGLENAALLHEIVHLGNQVRVANFKARARRDPSLVEEGLKRFEVIGQKLDEIEKTVRTEERRRRVREVREAAGTYRTAMADLLRHWKALEDLNIQRDEAGRQVLSIVQKTAEAGMKQTLEVARKTGEDLSSVANALLGGLVVAVLVGFGGAFLLVRNITRPLNDGVELATRMAEGDLSRSLETDRRDEVGSLTRALGHMAAGLREMFQELASGMEQLAGSATSLLDVSGQMAEGAEKTTARANTVATAAEEMSVNMSTVAASTEQASSNLTMVASAAEEMSASIGEIAENTERARAVTEQAVSRSSQTSQRVGELGRAAEEIGKVTETITEISEQTNLLALNATIEAARAGEAGKGFAVVANEIKELAKQTASATDEIRARIEGIQTSTHQTVSDIEEISRVIQEVNDIVGAIAAAVEEQTATTREIAENVAQGSMGVQEITGNVAQTSSVSGEIARDIAEVSQSAGEMADGGARIKLSAEELARLAERVRELMGRFKTGDVARG